MAIFNMSNGGGESFDYKVIISEEKPTPIGNKNILWIKDNLTNLNPYDKSIQPQISVTLFPNAYKDATTTVVTSQFVDEYVIYLNKKETKSLFYYNINSSKRNVLLRVPKKYNDIYQEITIGLLANDTTLVEGEKVYDVTILKPNPDEDNVYYLTSEDIGNIIYKINKQDDTDVYIEFNEDSLTTDEGNSYKQMLVNYNTENTTAPKYSHHASTIPTTVTANFSATYGDIKKNIVIADNTKTINSAYIITEPSKYYKIFNKGNSNFKLFTIDTYPSYNTSGLPEEGCEGKIISVDESNVSNTYTIVSGEKYPNICFSWNISEEMPVIEDYTYGYTIKLAYDLNHLSKNYTGYYIDNFEPTDLKLNTTDKKVWIWFLSGNNVDINFKTTKSKTKQHFTSIKSALIYLHLKDNPNEFLYFLKGGFYNKETGLWSDFIEDSSTNNDFIQLIEGNLQNLNNNQISKVANYAFYNYNSLQSVNLENCTWLGTSAFQNCTSLQNVNLPNWDDARVQYLIKSTTDSSPFAGCTQITSANIGFTAICGASDMSTTITVTKNYHTTGYSPFNSARLTLSNLALPRCSLINSSAFAYYTSLNKLSFGTSVDIGKHGFLSCGNLEIINGANNIQFIRMEAFKDCIKLDNINLNGISWINTGAFSNCTTLTTIGSMPALEWIGSSAFYNTNISSFIAPNCIHFSQNSTSLTVLNGLTIAKTPFNNCSNLQNIEIGISCGTKPYNLPAIFIGDNFPILNSLKLPNISYLTAVTAANASKAAYGCFRNLSYISYVELSNELYTIENAAFKNCAILNQDTKKIALLNGQNQYEYLYEIKDGIYIYGDKNEEGVWIYNPNYIQYEPDSIDISSYNLKQYENEDSSYYNIIYKNNNEMDILYTYTTKKDENENIKILGSDNNYYDIYVEDSNFNMELKFEFSPNRKYQIKLSNPLSYHQAEGKYAQAYDEWGQLKFEIINNYDEETGKPIYDITSNPVYDYERPLYDLTRPVIYEAEYIDEYLYEKELDENENPILDDSGQFKYISLENQYYGLKYVNRQIKDPYTGENIPLTEGLNAPNIHTIGVRAFQNCSNLQEFYMNPIENIGTILSSAFLNCVNLNIISAPKCTEAQINAFNTCNNITTINLSQATLKDGTNNANLQTFFNPLIDEQNTPTFNYLKEIILNNVEEIPQSCFKNYLNLDTASFSNCITINNDAFINTKFKYINSINSDYEIIPSNINIPNVITINDNAFQSCTELLGGQLLKVINIGDNCFANCGALKEINDILDLNNDDMHEILYLNSIEIIGNQAFKECYTFYNDGNSTGLEKVVIPSSVRNIGEQAFIGCNKLTNLSFKIAVDKDDETEEYITTLNILSNAFYNCPITSVTIPPQTRKINNGAFVFNRESPYTIDLTEFDDPLNKITLEDIPNSQNYENHAFAQFYNGSVSSDYDVTIIVKNDTILEQLKQDPKWKHYSIKSL